jgi:hypothetical protein
MARSRQYTTTVGQAAGHLCRRHASIQRAKDGVQIFKSIDFGETACPIVVAAGRQSAPFSRFSSRDTRRPGDSDDAALIRRSSNSRAFGMMTRRRQKKTLRLSVMTARLKPIDDDRPANDCPDPLAPSVDTREQGDLS